MLDFSGCGDRDKSEVKPVDLAHYYLQKILLSSVYDVAKVTPLDRKSVV